MTPRILIDSSCWIDFFRESDDDLVAFIENIIKDELVAICGPVLTEVLGGFSDHKEALEAGKLFGELHFLELTRGDYESAATLRRDLRAKGQIFSTLDILIAKTAMKYGVSLLHSDADFNRMARHTRLKLYRQD